MPTTPNPKQEPPLPVIFRTWRKEGDTIAIFPTVPDDLRGYYCQMYQHIGQHGGGDSTGVIRQTRPATQAEAAELRRELEAAPYHYRLKEYRKETRQHRAARMAEAARMRQPATAGSEKR